MGEIFWASMQKESEESPRCEWEENNVFLQPSIQGWWENIESEWKPKPGWRSHENTTCTAMVLHPGLLRSSPFFINQTFKKTVPPASRSEHKRKLLQAENHLSNTGVVRKHQEYLTLPVIIASIISFNEGQAFQENCSTFRGGSRITSFPWWLWGLNTSTASFHDSDYRDPPPQPQIQVRF